MASETQTIFNNDVHVAGALSMRTVALPAGAVGDDEVAAAAGIAATKLEHQHVFHVAQAPGSAVVAQTADVHIVRAAGSIVAIEAAITGAVATGADRHVTIDLQVSTGEAAFASVLNAVIDLDDGATLRNVVVGAIDDADLVDGDLLRVVIAVSGSAGNQAQGLVVVVTIRETAQ